MARALQDQRSGRFRRRAFSWPLLRALFLLAIVAAVGCLSARGFAPISPGPLSRAHESLNGALHCTDCHRFGSAATLKCLSCHTEIAGRLGAGKGLHATYKLPKGNDNACSKCHSEHNGEDFALIKWDTQDL